MKEIIELKEIIEKINFEGKKEQIISSENN